MEYHHRTEVFDRSVCSATSERGFAMPATHWQRGEINKNAIKVKRDLAQRYGLSSSDMHKAIKDSGWDYENWFHSKEAEPNWKRYLSSNSN